MAALQSGIIVNFGYTGTDGIAATGLTGNMLLQSSDFEHGHDEEQIKDATGALATRVFYNIHKKATLEVIPSGSSVANAVTAESTLMALMRTILNITACASHPELVGTNWLVVAAKSTKSNTAASKVTLSLEQHAGITVTPA